MSEWTPTSLGETEMSVMCSMSQGNSLKPVVVFVGRVTSPLFEEDEGITFNDRALRAVMGGDVFVAAGREDLAKIMSQVTNKSLLELLGTCQDVIPASWSEDQVGENTAKLVSMTWGRAIYLYLDGKDGLHMMDSR